MAGVTSLNSDFQNIVTPAAEATEVAATNLATSLVASSSQWRGIPP